MRWQNPWAWIGLLTLALPVLVHLFSRRPARVEPFPSLRFLDVSRLLPTRRTRLTDRVLLLVRMAIVAMAVAALAQPLWRATGLQTSTSVARAIVIDTFALHGDSTALATVERDISAMERGRAASMRIPSAAPHHALDGAVAWLRTQRGRAELVVVSDFRQAAVDSLDLVSMPADITVRLVRAPAVSAAARAGLTNRSTMTAVRWAHALAPARAANVRQAVRALGGTALTDASSRNTAAHRIIIASPGADSLQAWLTSAQSLSAAWMGDVAYGLHGDTALATAAASIELPDTVVDPSEVVVAWTANRVPVITAASIRGVDGAAWMLIRSRAPAEALVTAALLLSASKERVEVSSTLAADSATSDAQLRRWEHTPAGTPRASGSTPRGDIDTGPSDARYLWLVVLLLMAVETVVRRRISSVARPVASPVITDG